MTDAVKTLTTAEYAKISGMAVSTITQLLREGKLNGEKRSGKWAIFVNDDQPQIADGKTKQTTTSPSAPKGAASYPIEMFAKMTYLTENGVRQWLKSGRLTGVTDGSGQTLVDAVNLERPELRHLIRK